MLAAKPYPVILQIAALLLAIAICFAVAGLGAAATDTSLDTWYRTLEKPSWHPPDWVFGPVWTVLYVMMAVSAWLVWRANHERKWIALSLFGVQLLLNLAWSGVFFGLQQPDMAFAEILVLWTAIAGTIAAFWQQARVAAVLLVPYLAWVTFASALNFAIWQLNA